MPREQAGRICLKMHLLLWGLCMAMATAVDTVLKPLQRLNITADGISISGLSSGADFAAQFSVAYSGSIMGVGVFAGEPWHCSATMFQNETLVPFGPAACGSVCNLVSYVIRPESCLVCRTHTQGGVTIAR